MEQEGDKVPSDTQESSEAQQENSETSDTTDLASTPVIHDSIPTEQPTPEAGAEPFETAASTTTTCSTTTAPPQPQPALQPGETQPVNPDNQSRAYPVPDAYRGVGGELYAGYGSLSRISLHGYWPNKNFQPGAHYTLPFLRDSYAPAGLSGQTEDDGLGERGESALDMKTEHPAVSYPTLGGIHQFRPITTMELLREPSRTR